MKQKGVLSYVVGFAIVVTLMLMLWTVIIPAVQQIQVSSFKAQTRIISDVNSDISSLADSSIKTAMRNSYNAQMETTTTNFDIMAFFIQYWWVFLVLIISLGTYVLSRRNVEVQGY